MARDKGAPKSVTQIVRERLPELRRKAGFTSQAALGDYIDGKLGGHLSRPAIAKIENGSRDVSLEDAILLAAALDCELGELIAPGNDSLRVGNISPISAKQLRGWLRGVNTVTGKSFLGVTPRTDERQRVQTFYLLAVRETLHRLEEAVVAEDTEAYKNTVGELVDRTYEQVSASGWSEDPDAYLGAVQQLVRQVDKKITAMRQTSGAKKGSK